MITIDSLRIRDGKRMLLDGVTMHLPQSAVHGIAGEGRGALLRAIYGDLQPEAGTISEAGHPLQRREMALLEADPRFWPGLTARDCIGLVRWFDRKVNPEALLRRFPVPLDTEAASLGAEARKHLGIILTLMRGKRILLLDEPFRELAPERIFVMQQLLLHLGSEGRTVILTSTRIPLIEGVCDDLYLLGGGKVLARYEHYELGHLGRDAESGSGFPEN